ncbi:MAG: SirB2 family protein [Nitrococcus sp.]|nr:SirB2 family protein [Nitrococcus sp.]
MSAYLVAKSFHITLVAATFISFTVRGVWMLYDSPLLRRRWVRVLPHTIDAIVLASGLYLAVAFYNFPAVHHPWIIAKLIGLLAYVVLGTIALKRGRTKQARLRAFVVSLLLFGYIVFVAVTKMPWPFAGTAAKVDYFASLGD